MNGDDLKEKLEQAKDYAAEAEEKAGTAVGWLIKKKVVLIVLVSVIALTAWLL